MSKRKNDDSTQKTAPSKKINSGHWALGLLKTMEDPKYIIQSDELITIIKDVYPKAEFHYLILPKANISNLKALNKDHIDLLKHMEIKAKELLNSEAHKHKHFKLGYHAEASMFRLHMHVISDDMNSPCLKTKKHWNSFNTDFFLNSNEVLSSLQKYGKVTIPSKETCKSYMDSPLKCHKCSYEPKNLPDLKKHIVAHLEKKN
nr:aprataxin [Leptinotarsa decemlineata]